MRARSENHQASLRHGQRFLTLFLDPQLVYSCAHFLRRSEDLATAQTRKLDLVCRKLGLAPGMSFLDVGCGWGALVVHAAVTYGVNATGITLSGERRRRPAAEPRTPA